MDRMEGDMEDKFESARENAKGWLASIEEMVAAIQAGQKKDHDTNDCRDYENAEQAIHESVLSVMVRDGWRQPGAATEGADEYEILLTTGGPALRIWGELGKHGEPSSAELQMQDWGTLWTRYPAPEATLLDFALRFYFGE
jgi:hypothetical protein